MGGAPTSSQANNTNQTSTTIGSLGFTGQNAVDILNSITFTTQNNVNRSADVANTLANVGGQFGNNLATYGANTGYGFAQLGAGTGAALAQAGVDSQRLGYTFGTDTIQQSLAFADRANARVTDTLVGTINAVRDFNQRGINAGLGSSSPISALPAASSSVPVLKGANEGISPILLVAAAGLAVFLLVK